ncbi:hypothetical protein GN330_12180 [Nitratireductor sp. CAU 1489]|uniref:Uncharacterized protein n=1 Tax=Nitratireductor arenosus TaxID=2682096 RepID=A0A844QF74_9HYPH|nr:hypothetical protein [Nitratireductor arenosus]MVA98002.1 hypothetical protein [Nitratireductor arenosus]
MNRLPRSIGAVIGINLQLLWAAAFGFIAWVSWPGSAEWWGFGVLSVMMGLGSLGALVNALNAITGLYARDKALAELMAQGGPPKSARLAGHDDLKRAGMVE